MGRDRDIAEEALLVALGKRAQRLRGMEPESLESLLRAPSADERNARREEMTREHDHDWLEDALTPLSTERQAQLLQMAEEALSEEVLSDEAAIDDEGDESAAAEPTPDLEEPSNKKTGPSHLNLVKTEAPPDSKPRARHWMWLIPLAAAAAIALVLAWPSAESLPRYALETQIGDAPMLSPSATSRSVSPGSLLQLVLRPPEATRQRPVVLLFVQPQGGAGDQAPRHVPAEVAWSEDGSARLRMLVSEALPNHRGPARLLLVVAPAGTAAADAAKQLRNDEPWPQPWRRYVLAIDVAP